MEAWCQPLSTAGSATGMSNKAQRLRNTTQCVDLHDHRLLCNNLQHLCCSHSLDLFSKTPLSNLPAQFALIPTCPSTPSDHLVCKKQKALSVVTVAFFTEGCVDEHMEQDGEVCLRPPPQQRLVVSIARCFVILAEVTRSHSCSQQFSSCVKRRRGRAAHCSVGEDGFLHEVHCVRCLV